MHLTGYATDDAVMKEMLSQKLQLVVPVKCDVESISLN